MGSWESGVWSRIVRIRGKKKEPRARTNNRRIKIRTTRRSQEQKPGAGAMARIKDGKLGVRGKEQEQDCQDHEQDPRDKCQTNSRRMKISTIRRI